MKPVTVYKRNILKTWRQVSPEDVVVGANWYAAASEIAREVGKGDVRKGAGILAAFSPMIHWSLNIEMAKNAVKTGAFVGHFSANNLKAERIWKGEDPEVVLVGNKVKAFFRAIASAGESDDVVVDRHALAVAYNRILSDAERRVTKRRYEEVAQAYREVAEKLGLPVTQLQAITWVNWRRRKGMSD